VSWGGLRRSHRPEGWWLVRVAASTVRCGDDSSFAYREASVQSCRHGPSGWPEKRQNASAVVSLVRTANERGSVVSRVTCAASSGGPTTVASHGPQRARPVQRCSSTQSPPFSFRSNDPTGGVVTSPRRRLVSRETRAWRRWAARLAKSRAESCTCLRTSTIGRRDPRLRQSSLA